jgi:hypothetical protein
MHQIREAVFPKYFILFKSRKCLKINLPLPDFYKVIHFRFIVFKGQS